LAPRTGGHHCPRGDCPPAVHRRQARGRRSGGVQPCPRSGWHDGYGRGQDRKRNSRQDDHRVKSPKRRPAIFARPPDRASSHHRENRFSGVQCPVMTFSRLMAGMVCLALAGGVACSKNAGQTAQGAGMQAMPAKGMETKATPVNETSEYVATLKSRDSAVIMPQVEGQITQIFVHSGDRIPPGASLMEIDPLKQQATVRSQESAREAQQAQLNWAKQQYQR